MLHVFEYVLHVFKQLRVSNSIHHLCFELHFLIIEFLLYVFEYIRHVLK